LFFFSSLYVKLADVSYLFQVMDSPRN